MDKLNSFSSFSRDRVSCVCWVYVPLYRYIPCISYQVLKKRINAWSVHTIKATSCTNTSRRHISSDKSLPAYWRIFVKIFVAAKEFCRRNKSHKFSLIWFLRLVAVTKFCCEDKDFHKTSVHTKRFVAATCRLTVLLQLVARPVHMEWSVTATCCCNLSPSV